MSRISTQLFVLAVSSFVLSCYAAGNTSRIDESAASTYPEHLARFPNGELVAVTMRPFPPMEVELSPKFASEHDELVSKAKAGDENAAYTLAESLRTCDQEGYGSVGELNQAMDDLRSTHSYRDRRGNLIELSGSYDGSIDLDAVARKTQDRNRSM